MRAKAQAAERGTDGEAAVHQAKLDVADTVGGLMEFWGFKRSMGRLWTFLYTSPEPRSAQEIGDALAMSAGAVSMTLQELLKWGTIRKVWRPGERRDFYAAETEVWRLVSRVFRDRELVMVRDARRTFADADGALARDAERRPREVATRRQFERGRIRELEKLAEVGERILRAFVEGERVDASPLHEASITPQGAQGTHGPQGTHGTKEGTR